MCTQVFHLGSKTQNSPHHNCSTVPLNGHFAKPFCKSTCLYVREIEYFLPFELLWSRQELSLPAFSSLISVMIFLSFFFISARKFRLKTVIFTATVCQLLVTSCKCIQCGKGNYRAMCLCIPHWHFKEMLAIMSGKPHAICLGVSETSGQKWNSGMFAWEYSEERRGDKQAVRGRNKFRYFSPRWNTHPLWCKMFRKCCLSVWVGLRGHF